MIPRPARYPNVDDVINFVQAKFHTRRGRMATTGLVFVAVGAVAVAPSLMHANEAPSRQSVVPQTSPIDIKFVPPQLPPTTTTIDTSATDLPVGVNLGSRLGGALPTPSTKPPVTAPPVTAPPVTAAPVTAPPVTAPPVTAPPVTAPPPTAPPVTLPPDGPIVVP